MPKLTIAATELVDTDVDFVSLVKKGANRIPFRIMKEDSTDMIDLHKIAKSALLKSAAATPAVLAVVLRKGADLEVYKQVITGAGLSVEKMEEADGLIIFKQDGASEVEPTTMKINDDMGLILTGLQKGFESWDFQSTTFKELFSTEGFFPSVWMGLDILGCAVGNIMNKAENAAEAGTQISAALDEFKGWVTSLTSSIPEHAFKAEQLLKANDWPEEEETDDKGEKVKKKKPKAKKQATKEDISSAPTFGNATSTAQVTPGGDQNIDGSPTHGNETPAASGGKQPNPNGTDNNIEGAPVAGSTTSDDSGLPGQAKKEGEGEADPNAGLLAALGAMIDTKLESAQKATTEAIGAVTAQVEKLDGQVKAVADRTQKMDVAINGTIDPGQSEDRQPGRTQKSVKAPPLLDTGLRPNTH